MMDNDMSICKICKKLFSDMQGLKKHQLTYHSNPTFGDNSKEIPHQFRNNNSISITRIQSKEQQQPSANVVVQSAIMQNQNSFRRVGAAQAASQAPANIRRNEMGRKGGDGKAKAPLRSPDMRMKNAAASSLRSMAPGTEVDDDTWQKWEPAHRERDAGTTTSADVSIISPSAAERATSAFCNSPANPRAGGKQPGARKGAPPPALVRVVPSNGKRPAPAATQRANPASANGGGVRGVANSSPVADIMQNLGKIKSLNAQANRPKMISVPPPVVAQAHKKAAKQAVPKPKAQLSTQQFLVSKPPQVSKNKQKIVPRNAFNNALPKPGTQKAPPPKMDDDEMDEDDDDDGMDEDEDDNPVVKPPKPNKALSKNPPPAKASTASPKAKLGASSPDGNAPASGGGKASSQKSLSTNRFNPIKNPKAAAAADATSRNGSSAASAKSAASTKARSPEPIPEPPPAPVVVVAKKSAPGRKPKKETNTLNRMKQYVPTMPGTNYEMPKLTAVGSYTRRSGDQVWVCLVCREKESEQSSRDMICCDNCEDWYHWECVGIFAEVPEEDPWFCKRCIFNHSPNPKKDFPKLFKNNVQP